MKQYSKLLAVFLVCSPVSAFAVTVSDVAGTFTNGETITISGSSFGSKSTPAPVISTYDHPTSANNISTGAVGGGTCADAYRTWWNAAGEKESASGTGDFRVVLYEE